MTDKAALRKQVRAAFPGADIRAEESRCLLGLLQSWQPLKRAKIIAAFMPLLREADITPLVWELAAEKELLMPRCLPGGQMVFQRVISPEELEEGPYHLLEPRKSLPIVPPECIDLMLIPVEAADRKLNRLGKGGGYYDRYLPGTKALKCGVALRYQLIDEVPTQAHDMPLDALATPDGILTHVY